MATCPKKSGLKKGKWGASPLGSSSKFKKKTEKITKQGSKTD